MSRRLQMVGGVAVVLVVVVGLLALKFGKPFIRRIMPAKAWDERLGVAVCADGVVLRNLSGGPIRDVEVRINDFKRDAVRMDVLKPNTDAQLVVSPAVTITQVVVNIAGIDQMWWTAEKNGRDPRSVAQRQKRMAEILAGAPTRKLAGASEWMRVTPQTGAEGGERVTLPVGRNGWMCTAVGFNHSKPAPWKDGNCLTFEPFGPHASELLGGLGKEDFVSWRVVNIHAENFNEITRQLGMTSVEAEVFHKKIGQRMLRTPEGGTKTQAVDEGDCIITDRRIPREWLRSAPCPSCFRDGVGRKYVLAYPDKFNAVP